MKLPEASGDPEVKCSLKKNGSYRIKYFKAWVPVGRTF